LLLAALSLLLDVPVSSASGRVVATPPSVAAGSSVEIKVIPQPYAESEFISAIASVGAESCPSESSSPVPPDGWVIAVNAGASRPASGFVNAAPGDPIGSGILVCAYQGVIGQSATRLIGSGSLEVVAPKPGKGPPARKSRRVFLKIAGTRPKARPTAIYPSPTAGPFAKELKEWRNWGSGRTTSEGTTYYDTCRPDCIAGTHPIPGRVRLSDVQKCGNQLRYLRLHFTYFHFPKYDFSVKFNCKGEAGHTQFGR
jgi:hypothetical protein